MRIAYLTSYDALDSKNKKQVFAVHLSFNKTLSLKLRTWTILRQFKPSIRHKFKWHLNQKSYLKKDYFIFGAISF